MNHALFVRTARTAIAASRDSLLTAAWPPFTRTANLASQAAPNSRRSGSPTTFLRKTGHGTPGGKSDAPRNWKGLGRSDVRNPAVELPNFAALPPLKERKVIFRRIDMETQLGPIFTRPGLATFRSSLFMLRASPVSAIPPAKPHPFPSLPNAGYSPSVGRSVKRVVFGVITTKAAVSKLASERQRCRTRFKAAVEAVVNRNALGESGDIMVQDNNVYIANLKREVYEVDFRQLVQEVGRGLKSLQMAHRYTPSTTRSQR